MDIAREGMQDTELTEGTDAGDNLPVVRVSEIYDMHTVKDKIGLIGVHTPTRESIDRKWHGYFLNHKFYKILSADVSIACASVLPLDPLGIGTDPINQVAPQDVMNPILYRAVSNESWNSVVARLYASAGSSTVGEVDTNSVFARPDAFEGDNSNMSQENLYYSLLASDEWRKAMPQAGLNMNGLRPLCYPTLSQFGDGVLSNYIYVANATTLSSASGQMASSGTLPGTAQAESASSNQPNSGRYFRGPAQALPRFPTCPKGIDMISSTDYSLTDKYHIVGDSYADVRAYVCAIVMPPSKSTQMFYRLRVSWSIAFDEPCSILENRTAYYAAGESPFYYKRSYSFESPNTLKEHDDTAVDDSTIESVGFEPKLIMEK